jgi:hypothetical protein
LQSLLPQYEEQEAQLVTVELLFRQVPVEVPAVQPGQ